MPIHDWTRAEGGDFHDFHQCWVVAIRSALNSGLLPPGYMAMAEQVTGGPIPDVVTLHARPPKGDPGGVAVLTAPPTARQVQKIERINYAKRADRIAIRHGRGKVVAIIEIVSPGNKDSRNAMRMFVEKAATILNQGISLLVVDLFPPTPRDPQGVAVAIWEEFGGDPLSFHPDKPLTVASFAPGEDATAYYDAVAVGDSLPSSPLFLSETRYIPAPLEETYSQAWAVFPAMLKELMGQQPGGDNDR